MYISISSRVYIAAKPLSIVPPEIIVNIKKYFRAIVITLGNYGQVSMPHLSSTVSTGDNYNLTTTKVATMLIGGTVFSPYLYTAAI